jgi:hypothetical protein
MPDAPRSIKIVDRRLFTSDGEVREEVKAELEAPDPAPAAVPQVPEPPPEPTPATDPAFLRLLDMLGQTAALYLEGFPDPATGRRSVDLTAVRQIVESLVALREKARARLSFEETDALDGMIGELQMAFTRMASGGKPSKAAPPAPKRG